MSNGERSSGDLVVNVFSGLGLLLGIVVGLSKSPVVAIVVAALTSLRAGGDSAFHSAYESSGENIAYVSCMGVPPFSLHICFIDGVGGKIARLRQEHYQPD